MATVKIKDSVLWIKDIDHTEAIELREKLYAMRAGMRVALRIDGVPGWYQKMNNGLNPTDGLKAVNSAASHWKWLYEKLKDERVSIEFCSAAEADRADDDAEFFSQRGTRP